MVRRPLNTALLFILALPLFTAWVPVARAGQVAYFPDQETTVLSAADQDGDIGQSAGINPRAETGTTQLQTGFGDRSVFEHNSPRMVPPFPLALNRTVRRYIASFLNQPRELRASFERIAPYLSEMVRELEQRGLPKDLVYLALAESGFSREGAGPWQLTKATARRFGLHINRWVDERRDPVKSTHVAAEFLASLHDQVGDWRLTVASWNRGEGSIDRFWALRGADYGRLLRKLPRCTRILLNRFMAVAFIAHNAETFGVEPIQYSQPPFKRVRVRGGTKLSRVAEMAGTNVRMIRALNPSLLRDRVPPYAASYEVWVPRMTDAETADSSTF